MKNATDFVGLGMEKTIEVDGCVIVKSAIVAVTKIQAYIQPNLSLNPDKLGFDILLRGNILQIRIQRDDDESDENWMSRVESMRSIIVYAIL